MSRLGRRFVVRKRRYLRKKVTIFPGSCCF